MAFNFILRNFNYAFIEKFKKLNLKEPLLILNFIAILRIFFDKV